MEKNTLIAVVLSVVVITIGFMLQNTFFPAKKVAAPVPVVQQKETAEPTGGKTAAIQPKSQSTQSVPVQSAGSVPAPRGAFVPFDGDKQPPLSGSPVIETKHLIVTFSAEGGTVQSIKLKDHIDRGQPLEMVQKGTSGINAFELSFGGPEAKPIHDLLYYSRPDKNTIVFYRNYKVKGDTSGAYFTLKKTYTFNPDDYMMKLKVTIDNSVNEYPPLNFNGYSYTLMYGPQIGPYTVKLNGRYDYRRYYTYSNGKRIKNRLKTNDEKSITGNVSWAALVGKYFTVIGIPDATNYKVTFSNRPVKGEKIVSELFLSRPLIKSSKNEDTFYFYIGPKLKKELVKYNKADKNGFNVQDLNLDAVIDTSSILGWLEWILLQILQFSYRLVPNYGIAIIILTIIIKTLLFPFTHKSFESTSRMQALTPKINELKTQYKDNPTKMNQEMQALYKRENVNPLGGCLPMLLQMPIFFALYGLLNKYFELRGAVFIPGWITDLSSPESIYNFAPFQIPILGWSNIRLLPILFTLTMVLSNKLMQNPSTDASGGNNMKMMTTLMPVMFFFIMYQSPSGLLLYWTLTNLITVVQQKYISRKLKKKKG